MKQIKREQFIWDFQNQGKIPSCYEKLVLNNKAYPNENAMSNQEPVVYVSLVPSYFNYTLVNQELYNQKKIIHKGKDGAAILIDGDYTIDSYLQKFTNKQLRTNLKRAIAHLEESFNITYECNFGSISEEKYLFLLSELKSMLEKRFLVKNMENMFLKEWNLNTKNLYALINKKQASIFVIYSDDRPISITINTHIDNSILNSQTNAFDTDYSKFSLGHIDNYLLLRWCLENKYHFLDLGIGVLDYKRRWCNLFYDFEYHIYSKKGSLVATSIASFEVAKIKLKNYLKKIKAQEIAQNIKSLLKKNELPKVDDVSCYNYEILTPQHPFSETNLKEIDLKNFAFKSIRQPIYDYLYTNKLHVDAIKTYELANEKNTFLCKAGNELIKIKK